MGGKVGRTLPDRWGCGPSWWRWVSSRLRHRFATQLYRVSRDLRMVGECLGHADPRTTAGYAAYAQEKAAEMVAAL